MNNSTNWLDSIQIGLDFLYGVFILFGVISNTLVVLVCFRASLRQTPTFIFIAFGAISNTFLLFNVPLSYFLGRFVLDTDPRHLSLTWCRLSYYLTFSFLYWTVWLVVTSSLEMFLAVRFAHFRSKYSNTASSIWTCALIGALSFGFNTPKLVLQGHVTLTNGTRHIECFKSIPGWKIIEHIGAIVSKLGFSLFQIN